MTFIGAWKINDWKTDGSATDGIPVDGAKIDGPLDIANAPTATSDAFRLLWLDQSGNPCSVSGLLPDPVVTGLLSGEDLNVSFGSKNVTCRVQVTLDQTGLLTCTIALPSSPEVHGGDQPDAGTGTFTATASPVG